MFKFILGEDRGRTGVFILDYLYFSKSTNNSTGKPFYEYKVNGKGVCQNA